jgi:regulator of sigma E protease
MILQYAWAFLLLIGVMILLHELGHYLVARLFDVHIEAFSFGFGPRLFGFKRGETDFKFCAFLLGGYVKMAGEQPGEISDGSAAQMDPRAFPAKPRWQRLLIIAAGPAVNFVLAIGILAGLYMYHFPKVSNPPNPVVGTLAPNGAAAKAGLLAGDRVVEFDGQDDPTFEDIRRAEIVGIGKALHYVVERNGQRVGLDITPVTEKAQPGGTTGWQPQAGVQVAGFSADVEVAKKAGMQVGDIFVTVGGEPIRTDEELVKLIEKSAGQPTQVVFQRDGKRHEVTLSAVQNKDKDGSTHWRIGAGLQSPPVEFIQLPLGSALAESWEENKKSALMLYKFLQGVIEQRMSPKSIDGPLGIARASGEAASAGVIPYLSLMAMVSLNLAVVNLLPIPLLDGGGILMLLIEMLMQRDLSMRVKEGIVKVGFAFLMMVIVFVFYNDITKLLPGG